MGGFAFASKDELFASAFWGMVWTMLVPPPKRERPAWDPHTTAVMKRVGISEQPTKPALATFHKGPVESFRIMEIIHIYDEDRCR